MKNIKNNLINLKSKVDKSDVDKLLPVLFDLSKLTDVLKIDVVKNTQYNELFKKVNNVSTTDTCNLVTKKLTITQKLVNLKIK